jgi:hypothetical protein
MSPEAEMDTDHSFLGVMGSQYDLSTENAGI